MSGQARALIESMPKEIATAATALSFDEAFTLHHRAVFRTARAVVRDSALAEDVTQEVFLRLYRNLDSTPGEELLRAWLLRVTLNVARNTLRGQNRAAARDDEYQKNQTEVWFPQPEEDYERRLAIAEARRAEEGQARHSVGDRGIRSAACQSAGIDRRALARDV